MRLFILISLALSAFLKAALAAPPPQLPNLKPLYDVQAGTTEGGCDNHFEDLQLSYREAVDAVKKALAAIEMIKKPQPDRKNSEQHKTWNRYGQLFTVLFGIRTNARDGTPEDENLKAVRGQYQ